MAIRFRFEVHELAGQCAVPLDAAHPIFTQPATVAAHLLPTFGSAEVEQFGVVLLNTRNRLIRVTLVTIGTLDSCLAHPREIFLEAITGRASSIIVFHNHPSGDPVPSPGDRDLTTRLREAGEILGIPVRDHLVLAHTRYYSFREGGLL